MTDKIIDLKMYRENLENSEIDNLWSTASDEKIMKLYNDIMANEPNDLEEIIEESCNVFTRATITELYDIGADPGQSDLSEDIIFITMLYHSAINEYFKGEYADSEGIENPMYRYLDMMKKNAGVKKL